VEAVNALYMEPERAMRRIKGYSSLITSTIHLSMLYLVMFLIWTVALVIIALIPETFGVSRPPNLLDVRNIFTFLLVNIIYFGVFIFIWMFSSFLFFLPAKLLGGKGTYLQQASLLAYIMVALFPLGFFAVLTVAIPAVGPIIAFLAIIMVSICSFYLVFLSIREVNQFKTVKALASFVISLAIFVFIAILIAGISVLILALLGNLPQPSF